MDITFSLAGITGALIAGAISPGPSFILVARTAAAASRRDGVAAAFGMGCGSSFFALIAVLGLHTLLANAAWLYTLVKTLGGIYLIYLAFRMGFRTANPSVIEPGSDPVKNASFGRSFSAGLGTQLANPKTAIVLGGIFAALLPSKIEPIYYLILPAIVFVIDIVWYSSVAYLLSSPAPRSAYLRYRAAIDRIAGGILVLLGIKLILSGHD